MRNYFILPAICVTALLLFVSPPASAGSTPSATCSADEMRTALAPGEAALVYKLGETESSLLLLTSGAATTYALPAEAEVAKKIFTFRKNLVRADSYQNVRRLLALELGDVLVGPTRLELSGVHRLIIAPSGALALLPFEALMAEREEDLAYMMELYDIVYAPDPALLCPAGRQSIKPTTAGSNAGEWAGFASPIPGNHGVAAEAETELNSISKIFYPDNRDVNLLSGAGMEKKTLSKLINLDSGEKHLYIGANSTERGLKAALGRGVKVLHISAGCVTATGAEGGAAIAVNPARGETDDGLLTATEIREIAVQSETIMLTGCVSGGAKPEGAQAASAIASAFLRAGAGDVVISLWDAPAEGQESLKLKFHRELKAGTSAETALRKIKLEMIAGGKPPAMWAGIILFKGAGDGVR